MALCKSSKMFNSHIYLQVTFLVLNLASKILISVCMHVRTLTCAYKSVFVFNLMLKATVKCRQQTIFLLLLSTLTFLNQLGEADSITVFNNGRKNEKILKVAIPPERLPGERKHCNVIYRD